ncbi:hypothetical protein BD289DRAFT_482797 [Coniella lustricola]|uniref:Uncharacterized protein n=1 Tax=Coniella lustricola TaxID=2025994 RepID=A0A2T3A7R8_9PEZI|nr:hypothetical protein BD289DRAFT_482797 [Coniella lustricola]
MQETYETASLGDHLYEDTDDDTSTKEPKKWENQAEDDVDQKTKTLLQLIPQHDQRFRTAQDPPVIQTESVETEEAPAYGEPSRTKRRKMSLDPRRTHLPYPTVAASPSSPYTLEMAHNPGNGRDFKRRGSEDTIIEDAIMSGGIDQDLSVPTMMSTFRRDQNQYFKSEEELL